ncbi:MAG: CHAT domain-containing tetratricopeptide repeat protein [Saprospiraceae bacterium]|nr:CHAT domain-containing tetratricopeptide repeat protein [Saprospiraceae bacterium]
MNFKDDPNRAVLSRQYNDLLPSMRSEPLKALPTLEVLLTKAIANLDERDTLLANIYFSVGKIYLDKGLDYDKALVYNEKALEIRRKALPSQHLKLGQSCHNTAMLLLRKGRFVAAKILATEAIAIKLAAPKIDSLSLLRSFNELAINNRMLGDYEGAKETATKVQSIAMLLKDTLNLGYSFLTLGSCQFYLKNYQSAVENYSAARQLFEKANRHTSSVQWQKEVAACRSNLGSTYRLIKKNKESARKLYLDLFNASKDSSLIINAATSTFEIANTEVETNKTAALKRYDEAIKLFGNAKIPQFVECWTRRGDALQQLQRLGDALESYQKAIGTMVDYQPDLFETPSLKDAPPSLELLDALAAKARIVQQLRYDTAGLHLTYAILKKCDTLIGQLMTTYDSENSKYILAEKAAPIYEQAIALALRFHQEVKTNKASEFANDALNFCEKTRAIALMDNLKDRRAKNFGGIPPALLTTERDLKSDIAFAQKELYDAPDSLKNSRQNALFEAKQAFFAFQKDLGKQFPKYFELKYQMFTPLSIAALQSRLDENTAAIEYFMADSKLYIFTISKQNFHIFEQQLPPQYKTDFYAFRRSLSDEKWLSDSVTVAKTAFLKNGFSLYKTFLDAPLSFLKEQKEPQNINRLRIIPDGILAYLPFELLLTKDRVGDWKGRNTPYLLRDYAVSYAYSAKLLDDNERLDGRNFGGFGIEYDDKTLELLSKDSTLPRASNLLNVGNEKGTISYEAVRATSSRRMNLTRLAFADDEVRNIGQLLESPNIFLNSAATKQSFIQNAPNYGILHLAMHGAIDERNPLNSGLIFSKNADSTNNYLSGYDLFGQELHAGLAVLSACNTGNGELRRGEGVMSLARAFAFAGCPSTIMSLWSIPDESTSTIMLGFYKYLKEGASKDIALQKAKLDYLETCSPQYQLPNYWGATVIIGNSAPVDFRNWHEKPLFVGGVFGGILGLILSAFGMYKFRFRNQAKSN